MFMRTPCFDCTRPERLPNGLCEKGCKVKAEYKAKKAEYDKQRGIEKRLNEHISRVIDKSGRRITHRYGGQG